LDILESRGSALLTSNEAIINVTAQFRTKITIPDGISNEYKIWIDERSREIDSFIKTVLQDDFKIQDLIVSEIEKVFSNSGFTIVDGKLSIDTDTLRDNINYRELSNSVNFLEIGADYNLSLIEEKAKETIHDLIEIDGTYLVKDENILSINKEDLIKDSIEQIEEELSKSGAVGGIEKTDKYLKYNLSEKNLEVRFEILKKEINSIDSEYFSQNKYYDNVFDFTKLRYDILSTAIDGLTIILKNGKWQVNYDRFFNLVQEKIDQIEANGINGENLQNAYNYGFYDCKTLVDGQIQLSHFVAGEPFQVILSTRKCKTQESGIYHTLMAEDYFITGKTLTLNIVPHQNLFWGTTSDISVRVNYIPTQACSTN
jgi:limonene-1,2-epoxide hydrolase